MLLEGPFEQPLIDEWEVIDRMLPLTGSHVLELGCGAAEKTRLIAERSDVKAITAVEIDSIQHQKNQTITDLKKVTFKSYGAEEISEPDNSVDIVLMFKSLHHVPVERMGHALAEIRRVLKPGGYAYISEPVFAGEFNEIMRLFHDEELVRRQAFDALVRAVDEGVLALQEEYFFRSIVKLRSFEQYQAGILNITHTDHQLSAATMAEVKRRFLEHRSEEGFVFEIPNRIDLLKNS